MARFSPSDFASRVRPDTIEKGWWVCPFINEYGVVDEAHAVGRTPEEAIQKAIARIEAKGGKPIGLSARKAYGKRGPNTSGKQWGRPKKSVSDYNYGLTELFEEIKKKVTIATYATAGATSVKVTAEMAKDVINHVYSKRGKYNVYTGNLDRSYMATAVQGRRISAVVYPDNLPKGNPVDPGTRRVKIAQVNHGNGLWVKQNSYKRWRSRRKGIKAKEYMRMYRYLKKWENIGGYRNKSVAYGRAGDMSGFGRMAGDKLNRIQSGIIIENTAPYADYVTRSGYQVPPFGAYARSYGLRAGHEQQRHIMIFTKRMLKAVNIK